MTLAEHMDYAGCPSSTVMREWQLSAGTVFDVECSCGAMFTEITATAIQQARKVVAARRLERLQAAG